MKRSVALRGLCLFSWTLGCSGGAAGLSDDGETQCTNIPCAGTRVCVSGTCVSRETPAPNWAIEIAPPSTSRAAWTEIDELPDDTFLRLRAEGRTTVTATFRSPSGPTNAEATGKVVVTARPRIRGRPDLIFEGSITDPERGSPVIVSRAALGQPGTIQILPLPSADTRSPPVAFQIDALGEAHDLTIPITVPIVGRLSRAIEALPRFVARAYQANGRVSNLGLTSSDGTFRLFIPQALATEATTVQLAPERPERPESPELGHPWFISPPLIPATDRVGEMGQIVLPDYQNPNYYLLPVVAEVTAEPVPGALVRATTVLSEENDPRGSTEYTREAVTDRSGRALLALSPGTLEARLYRVLIIPPPGSPFEAGCATLSVSGGEPSPTAPSALGAVVVPRRHVLSGQVITGSGAPVSGVAIRAQRPQHTNGTCTTPPAIAAARTDHRGKFELRLDTGTYEIDYDPPPGSIVARLTEADIEVAGDRPWTVVLPAGALVEGEVLDEGNAPVAWATVRIFEPRCNGIESCFGPARTPPILRAQTQTDEQGRFRAIVPRTVGAPP